MLEWIHHKISLEETLFETVQEVIKHGESRGVPIGVVVQKVQEVEGIEVEVAVTKNLKSSWH